MRKTLRSVLLLTFCVLWLMEKSVQSQPAADTTIKGLASPGASVAILDLFNLSNNPEYDSWEALWGRGIRRAAFAHKELKVISFPYIHAAIQELKVEDYYIAPEQVPPLGKKLGADFVVLGSFTVHNNMIAASLKVVDGKTGRLLKEETRFAEAAKPNEFIGDLSNTLLKILLGPGVTTTPPPAVVEAATSQEPPLAPASPEVPSAPVGAPIPSEPVGQAPPIAPPVAPPQAEIIGPEEIEGAAPVGVPIPAAPAASPAPGAVVQPAPSTPAGQPQTMVKPIEAEIPSLPRSGGTPPQAVQSPFQPMPVLPAPPPAPRMYAPPAQPQMPMANPQMAQPGMGMRPPQQPQPQPYVAPAPVEQPGRIRRFFSWVTRPFRPAENLPPPQVTPPVQPQTAPMPPQMRQQTMPQTMPPQPAPTPAPSGNAVTRFFGRMFGRGSN